MNTLPGDPNYPPGTLASDIDPDAGEKAYAEADDAFWSQWWDEKCRFAEENERGE